LSAPFEGHLRQVEARERAVEVVGRLHGPIEERRIGAQQLGPLLGFGIGVVFVVGVLRREPHAGEQAQKQE
jgi:hypothetical protein